MRKIWMLVLFFALLITLSGCIGMDPQFEDNDLTFHVELNDEEFQLDSLRPLINAHTHDGREIQTKDIHITGNVDVHTPGTYSVIVMVYDGIVYKDKKAEIVVSDTKAPVLHATEETIKLYRKTTFDPDPKMNLIFAFDEADGDLTDQITYEGSVNAKKAGTYPITYTVKDAAGNEASATVNYVVTSTKNEFLQFIYQRTIDFYWGRFFVTDKNGKVLNYDDALYYGFTNAGTAQFERASGLAKNSDKVESGILLEKREDGIYVSEKTSVKVNNYKSVSFTLKNEGSRLVEYTVDVHYALEGKKDLVLKNEFSMKKVSGKYYVEYFLLPNS